MSWLPVISQIKSVVQLVTFDVDGAIETQKQFYKKCPVVSQTVAGAQRLLGYKEASKKTWNEGVDTLNGVVNGVPIVGHVKSGIHYACGNKEAAVDALNSANRSTLVMEGGILGFLVGGPVGAVVGGISAGTTNDAIHTIGKGEAKGHFANAKRIVKDKHPAGAIFDLTLGVVLDGVAGKSAAQTFESISNNMELKSQIKSARAEADALSNQITDNLDNPNSNLNSADLKALGDKAMAKNNYANHLEGVKTVYNKDGTSYTTTNSASVVKPYAASSTCTNQKENQTQQTNQSNNNQPPNQPNRQSNQERQGSSSADNIRYLNPHEIRFSQSTVFDRNHINTLIRDMMENGWRNKDGVEHDPIDAVLMEDGRLTSVDNRRLLAARQAGIQARVRIHQWNDQLPANFHRVRLDTLHPRTWQAFVWTRCINQTPTNFGVTDPYGVYEAPEICDRQSPSSPRQPKKQN